MKNVLIVNKFFYPDIGGVETVVRQHVNFLKGHSNIVVLCVNKKIKISTSFENIDGVKIVRCSSFGTYFSMPVSFSFFYYYMYFALKSDVLIHHAPFPLADIANVFLPKRLIKKMVIFWHSDIFKQKKLKKILNLFVRSCSEKSDIIITTSKELLLNSKELLPFKYKTEVVPLSVDAALIKSYVSNDSLEKKWDFIFLGRLCYYKGVDVLLEAVTILNNQGVNPKILIVGDGELSDYIGEFIIENNTTNVTFINKHVSENEKYNLIASSNCFLFPSVAPSEAFGITQLEALALSVPVINTNLRSGVPTVSLHGKTGLTVEAGNATALALAMKQLYLDCELRELYSKNAPLRISHYYDDSVVAKLVKQVIL